MTFWVLWSVDVLAALVVLFFFLAGIADGSVSSFNLGIWTVLLAAVAAVVCGGWWLRSNGRTGLAAVVLSVLAVPAVLYMCFVLLVITSGTSWN